MNVLKSYERSFTMRKQSFYGFIKLFTLVVILFVLTIFTVGCDESSTDPSSSTATVSGTLNLPADATGKTWAVLIDDDMDGDNGYVKLGLGICGAGTEVSYSVSDVPTGTYFIYAAVFLASDGTQGPQTGDYFGIYGGQFPNNIPTSPNANVGSGSNTFNIDLYDFQTIILQNEIIAHWKFNEMSGTTLNDESIYNHDGTIVNAQWVTGYNGGALQFQDSSYVNVPYSAILQPTSFITIEAILKFSSFSENQGIISTNENGGYGLWIYNTRPEIFIQIDSVYYAAEAVSGLLNLNQWYHIAGVFNGSELKFYVNGNLEESVPVSGSITYLFQNALKIGSDASATDAPDAEFFQGTIDEIRITRIALSPYQFLSF